jgi:hypothetical protein
LEKGEVLAYAEEVCSKVEPIEIQKVEVAEQEVQEKGKREIHEMTEIGGTLHPLTRDTLVSFLLTKELPAPKLMGITSPAICSFFSLRCRDTPLASKKSKPSNIYSSIGAT